MKNFVTGWRRAPSAAGRDAGPKVEREPLPPPLPKPPRPEIVEPPPAPPTRSPRRPPAPPEPEIIDAPRAPRRPPQPLNFPAFRPPGNLGQWIMLAVWAGLFKLSTDATHVALGGVLESYTWAVAVQAAISCIERFHFAGNRNGFTWGALAFDTLLTATGLGLALLPAFFTTPVYGFMVDMMGGFGSGGFTGFSLGVLAIVFGFIIAYSGDKALDLAVGR